MSGMRAPLVLPLVALLVLTPFVSTSTFEAWTDGIYDAESDGFDQAAKSAEVVVECAPLAPVPYIPVVVSLGTSSDDRVVPAADLPVRPGRAPPAS